MRDETERFATLRGLLSVEHAYSLRFDEILSLFQDWDEPAAIQYAQEHLAPIEDELRYGTLALCWPDFPNGEPLPSFQLIRSFCVERELLRSGHLSTFLEHPALRCLRHFSVDARAQGLMRQELQLITTCEHLSEITKLGFTECQLGSGDAQMIAECPFFSQVQSLSFYINKVRASGMVALLSSPHLALHELRLDYNAVGGGGLRGASFEIPPTLRSLELRGNNLEDVDMQSLFGCEGWGQLEVLGVSSCKFGDPGAKALADGGLVSLKSLDLSHTPIQTQGVIDIAQSTSFQKLESLNLFGCTFGPAASFVLAAEGTLPSLKQLSLSTYELEPEVIEQMAFAPALDEATRRACMERMSLSRLAWRAKNLGIPRAHALYKHELIPEIIKHTLG